MKVLVVDDEDDLRELARMFLEIRGHDAIEASSGEEALELLEISEPDVLLLDLRMPGIGGWGVLDALEERGRLAELPVVVISAHADSAIAHRAMELGCRGYLAKPFTGDDLQVSLEEATA
jgi:CheY-like chemotaxis protein